MNSHLQIGGLDAGAWDDFVATSPNGHLLQSSRWAHLKSASGWDSDIIAIRNGHGVVGGAQVLFRSLSLMGKPLPVTMAYVPKGPVVDYTDTETLAAVIRGLDKLCRERGAFLLKVEPDQPYSKALHEALAGLGFHPSRHSIQPRSTVLLDLRDGIDTCLEQMSSKTRYNIRLAARKGITVSSGTEEDIPSYYQLAVTTGHRDRFAIHRQDYYSQAYRLFREDGHVQLFLANFEGTLLAGLMAFAFGQKSWYLFGASSNKERQRMPNHALQWAAISWARDKGCQSYDLWGIPDEAPMLEANQDTRLRTYLDSPPPGSLWGVYRFKRGFGGTNLQYIGAYDRVYSSVLYRLYDKVASRKQGQSA